MNHTPGPWIIDNDREDFGIRIFAGKRHIALVDCYDMDESQAEQEYVDARLIAAAPALLSVARKVEECRENGWEWGKLIEELQDMARLAISEAVDVAERPPCY